MKGYRSLLLGTCGLLLVAGCTKDKGDSDVVSQRYTHKYGYAVSKEEFENRGYPGQSVTLLKNGVTITTTYENGVMHGPCTYTYPHSQTVEKYCMYNQGQLVKETSYDIAGMPLREEVQLSPSRYSLTCWYADGTPMSTEEYANSELLEGQYFSTNNDVEAQVVKGNGERVRRDQTGLLLAKEKIEEGFVTRSETFYPSGTPESVAYYNHGKLNGEKKSFTATGEPLCTKEYVNGLLHGKSTFYKNGMKFLEVSYLDNVKNGLEVHFIDGDTISQEIPWENDKKHGPAKYYVDGVAQLEYFYDGKTVSQDRWKELSHIDEVASDLDPRAVW